MVQNEMIEEIVQLLRSANERKLMITLSFIRSLIQEQLPTDED